MIIFNTGFLETLDDRNFKNGMVEIIKMGAINDLELFETLKSTNISDLRKDSELLFKIMRRSCEDKKKITKADLKESKLRKILNFGHTIGHAVEAHENGRLLHGEAIAIGIKKELELAVYLGLTEQRVADDIIRVLEVNYEMDTKFPKHLDLNSISKFLTKDKKNIYSKIH